MNLLWFHKKGLIFLHDFTLPNSWTSAQLLIEEWLTWPVRAVLFVGGSSRLPPARFIQIQMKPLNIVSAEYALRFFFVFKIARLHCGVFLL